MKATFLRYACWGTGVIALAAGLAGARAVMKATPVRASAPASVQGEESGVVCFGHVDVEEGVTALSPTQPGKVVEVPVKENQAVKSGDVLLRLDDQPARHRLAEAEQDLRGARARLDQVLRTPDHHLNKLDQQKTAIEAARHRLAAAEYALAQKQKLRKDNFLSENEVQAAANLVEELRDGVRAEEQKLRELELIDPTTDVARAKADVAVREVHVEQARWALAECVLRAPADGTVLRIQTRPGEVLSALQPQPALLFCTGEARLIRVEVEQEFAAHVAVGVTALVHDDAPRPERSWAGKVVRVSDWFTHRRSILREPLQVNDVRTLECLVALNDGHTPLRIGQRVRVRLLTGKP